VSDALSVSEMFLSAQGEGIHLGARQVFVRLAGCNLHCPYCDTPLAAEAKPVEALVRRGEDPKADEGVPNPLEPERVVELVGSLGARTPLHSVSWTGGEPLLQPGGLGRAMECAREAGFRNYLETNGTLADAMAALAPLADFVAADVKLPSASGLEWNADSVRGFLSAAATCGNGEGLFVKVVVCDATAPGEVAAAARVLAEVGRATPMVIQPVSPVGGVRPPAADALLDLQAAALEHLEDVRIIAQAHKKLGLR